MQSTNRREFLRSSALLVAGSALASYSFGLKKKEPLLAFSTLGCPDWTFDRITGFAVDHGYRGVELRGLQRQMDLTQCPEFISPESRKATLKLMQAKGLAFVGLGSSANLHFPEGAERRKNLEEGRRFIDLAQEIGCPYVRVFPNNFPKDQQKEATMDLITQGLLELARHAEGSKVTVLMETHGDLVHTSDLVTIMEGARHRHTGLVWDITNMWSVTGEAPALVYPRLKEFIRHTHIKDARIVAGKPEYTLLGAGEVPIAAAIKELVKANYAGFYSFEWEKLWHPQLAEPEIALAHFPKAISKIITSY